MAPSIPNLAKGLFQSESVKKDEANAALIQNHAQTSLLYQLEQRKTHRLEQEVLALRERIQAVTNNDDEARIKLLAADRTKRQLVQLKAITKRTIASLESGLKEYNAFINDIDLAITEQEKQGALPVFVDDRVTLRKPGPVVKKPHEQNLKRIAESPPRLTVTPKDALTQIKSRRSVSFPECTNTTADTNIDVTPKSAAAPSSLARRSIAAPSPSRQKPTAAPSPSRQKSTAAPSPSRQKLHAAPPSSSRHKSPAVASSSAQKSAAVSTALGKKIETPFATPTKTSTAESSSVPSGSTRKKRSVSKVVSYKEPGLNTKMRREC